MYLYIYLYGNNGKDYDRYLQDVFYVLIIHQILKKNTLKWLFKNVFINKYTHTHTYICIYPYMYMVKMAKTMIEISKMSSIAWSSIKYSRNILYNDCLQMYIYMYMCICIYIYMYMVIIYSKMIVDKCIYTYIYKCIYMYIYIHIYTYIHIYIQICIYIYIHIYIHIYIYKYMCVYVYGKNGKDYDRNLQDVFYVLIIHQILKKNTLQNN
jgi:hypothetical protein